MSDRWVINASPIILLVKVGEIELLSRLAGTLGIILAAQKRGLIPAARPVCEKIVEAGLLIEGSLLEKALMFVGE